MAANDRIGDQTTEIIPVVEEQVIIGKEVVERGSTIIHKNVNTEEVTVEVPLQNEHIHIERVPLNQLLETPPAAVRQEGNTTIYTVIKEVLVKKILLVEEIRVTKDTVTLSHSEKVLLRKEEVTVSKQDK